MNDPDYETALEAIAQASYALDPNQGEHSNPGLALMWLRTAYPKAHVNYLSREQVLMFRGEHYKPYPTEFTKRLGDG